MPFNGSGTYNPIGGGDFPAVDGQLIRAAQYNNEIYDLATALTNCLTRDGQSPPTANLPMAGMRLTGLSDGVSPQDSATKAQLDAATFPMTVVSGTTQTAVAGGHYVLTNAATSDVALPAGVAGNIVLVTVANGLPTNTITPNGTEEIEGSNTALTLDILAGTVWLRYVDNSKDWRLM